MSSKCIGVCDVTSYVTHTMSSLMLHPTAPSIDGLYVFVQEVIYPFFANTHIFKLFVWTSAMLPFTEYIWKEIVDFARN
jgi:hypothetical protein